MVKDGDYVAIFNSIHRVMQAERLLKDKKLKMLLIPAPRAVASDCGLAIRYAEEDRSAVEAALTEAGIMPGERYRKSGDEFIKIEESI